MHTHSRLETHFSGCERKKSQPFRNCELFPWRIAFLFGRTLFPLFFSEFWFWLIFFENINESQYSRATIERRSKVDTFLFIVVFRIVCIIRLRSSMINGSRCATTLHWLSNIAANMIYDLVNWCVVWLMPREWAAVCIQSIDLDNEKSIHQCTHVNGNTHTHIETSLTLFGSHWRNVFLAWPNQSVNLNHNNNKDDTRTKRIHTHNSRFSDCE